MLFLGNVDKLIYFRFYRRVNLQEIITAQNEMPILIQSKSIPTIGCKRRKFPSKKERNRQLFPFKKEIFCFYLILVVSVTCIIDESIYVEKQMARFCLLEKRGFSWTAFQSVCSNLPIPVLPINFKRVCIFCLSFFFTSYYYITY